MTVTIDEDPADPSVHEPRVTGSPEAIWLVYGELERDDTHANCCTEGEVAWCEEAQFAADVRYTRTDRVGELVCDAVAAEQKRWVGAIADMAKAAADNNDLRVYGLLRGLNDALFRPNADL